MSRDVRSIAHTLPILLSVLAACAAEDTPAPSGIPEAERVVQGMVTDVRARREGGLILTRARIEVERTFVGPASSSVEVEVPGGVLGGIGQHVSDTISLTEGEEVILYLARAGDAHVPAAGAASKLVVTRPEGREPMVARDGADEAPVPLTAVEGALQGGKPALPTEDDGLGMTRYVRATTAPCGGPELPLAWFTREIPYVIDAAGSDDLPGDDSEVDAVLAAAQSWNDVACSDVRLAFAGTVVGAQQGFVLDGPNQNAIAWVEGSWPYSPSVIALATVTFRCSDGEILDSDILLNGVTREFTTAPVSGDTREDVQNTMTHELGHLLGFGHSPDAASTMYPTAEPGETIRRTLARGDTLGLCDVYLAGAAERPALPRARGPQLDGSDGGDGGDGGGDEPPTEPPPSEPPPAYCGDGLCGLDEGPATCPVDCLAAECGNGWCEPGEDETTCPGDCAFTCHDVCLEGPKQDPSCGECQAAVCAADPFCCGVTWDAFCVDGAVALCGATCGG